MDLQQLANMAEIIGVIVVVTGIIFGVVQIRDYRRQRTELAAIEVVRSFQSPQMAHAVRMVMALPDNTPVQVIEDSAELSEAVFLVGMTSEAIAVLVHRRIVPLDLVGQLMGGLIEGCWRRCGPYFAQVRKRQRWGQVAEWYEWLVAELRTCDCSPAPRPNSRGQIG